MATSKAGLDPKVISSADSNTVWQTFRNLYLNYRNDMVINYINANAGGTSATVLANLQKEKKQLVFTNIKDTGNLNGFGPVWYKAVNGNTTNITDSANVYVSNNNLNTDKCELQRPFWAAKLLQCEQLINYLNRQTHTDSVTVNSIINTILDSMVMVCHASVNSLQPYGASTVNPNFIGNPRSFEDIVNHVFALPAYNIPSNIPDSNYFCNPFTIDAPKAYGQNIPLFANISKQVDSCNCLQYDSLLVYAAEANYINYATPTLKGFNQYLLATYQDTISTVLWNGLQNCSLLFTDTCFRSRMGSTSDSRTAWPGLPDTCIVYSPIILPSYTIIPAF
jgi:hypothetical protein